MSIHSTFPNGAPERTGEAAATAETGKTGDGDRIAQLWRKDESVRLAAKRMESAGAVGTAAISRLTKKDYLTTADRRPPKINQRPTTADRRRLKTPSSDFLY